MFEPPNLPEDAVRACLRERYGLGDVVLTFIPLGADPSAWAYRAEPPGGPPLFLKLRRGALNQAALEAPFFLHRLGVPAVAPLPAAGGALWAGLGEYALVVYPFVAGRMAAGGLTDEQWATLGSAMRRMHDAPVPPELARTLRRERFAPDYLGELREVAALVAADALADDPARELAAIWRANAARIAAVVEQAEALGGALAARGLPEVLCHADLHTWNVMVGDDGRIWIVDWDEVVVAPRERDLMFVVGGISAQLIGPREEAGFFAGYGAHPTDREALRYYRCAWAVQDIGSYAGQLCLAKDQSEASRREALKLFAGLFAPGEIVEIALGRAL